MPIPPKPLTPERRSVLSKSDYERPQVAARAKRSEVQTFARMVLRDPVYRAKLIEAARNRTLPPAVEVMLYAYAYGKPVERVEIGRPDDFSDLEALSVEQLRERALRIVENLAKPPEEIEELYPTSPLRLIESMAAAEKKTDGATHEPDLASDALLPDEGILRGPYNGGAPRGGQSDGE
jgi:hypothetical protein